MLKLQRLGSKGDTIVEVLLAIAVVSAVLSGAYVATNRSLNGVRQSQERGEALKFIEGQLERLKEAAKKDVDPAGQVFTTSTNPFCLDDSLVTPQAPTSPACNQGIYHLEIRRTLSSGAYTFAATATWERITGGQDQLTIRYRAYPQ